MQENKIVYQSNSVVFPCNADRRLLFLLFDSIFLFVFFVFDNLYIKININNLMFLNFIKLINWNRTKKLICIILIITVIIISVNSFKNKTKQNKKQIQKFIII